MQTHDAPRARLPARVFVAACVLVAAVPVAGCQDEVMAEALSPSSRVELQAPAAAEQPEEAPPLVVLLPMGKVRSDLVEVAQRAVEHALKVKTRVDPPRELPASAWYAPRKRWRAEKILDAVDADLPKGAWKTVVLVDVEISTTKGDVYDWGIGGLGNIGGTSAVVSTYLVRKNSSAKELLATRLHKLTVHEFGHTLGLPHCEVMSCVMSDAKGRLIRSLDASTDSYCGKCRKLLPHALLVETR